MRTVTEFPYEIIEEPNLRVPVTDGLELSARVWRPKHSSRKPVPAILEYVPYRKRFGTAVRDEKTHKYLAGHGYACVRLDIRGSGESDGVLTDEYLQTELDDGVRAIHWIAAQDWCDGNLGMMGISWGGFNALQIAAMQPEPLKAIVTVASSDDRFADDVHHMGGTLLGDNLSWASVMFSYNTMPPDPALVGDRWRDMWIERLEGSGLWLKTWLSHQRRDRYWRRGSVCENYDSIRIPVFAVSGWADGYTNTVFRLMKNLDVPRKGLVGPWGHIYPHFGRPGPAIDFLGELLRWWDRWLKGRATGVEDDPMICAWMQDSVPPNAGNETQPGRWVGVKDWSEPGTVNLCMKLGNRRSLVDEADNVHERPMDVQSPVTLGMHSGKWCSYATGPDLAGDQRPDDGGALVFQTAVLEDDLEILGSPVVELELASEQPLAQVAVRLSDMRPDHQVTRVTYGLLNLSHRDGSENPEPLEQGMRYRVRIPLNYVARRFPAGHRIRLSVSTVYWPLAWTPPESVRLKIWTGASQLLIPARVRRESDTGPIEFGEPVCAPGPELTSIQSPEHRWLVKQDLANKSTELEVIDDRGIFRLEDIDLTVGAHAIERYCAYSGDFSSVRGTTEWIRTLSREDWSIRTRTRTTLTADSKNFYISAELDAYEGETRVRCLSWNETIARDHL